MPVNLILPVVLLMLSLAGALVILRIEGHRTALSKRVTNVAGDKVPAPEREDSTGIRVAPRSRRRLVMLAMRVLRFPQDLPQAHVIPPWMEIRSVLVKSV